MCYDDSMDEKLKNLGWDDFFESKRAGMNMADFSVARVMAEYKGGYKIKSEKEEYLAKIRGKQIFKAKSREDYPTVGDWVAISELDNEQAVIEKILPRKSIIKRRFGDRNKFGEKKDIQIIAANIDVAFIVQSIGRDWSINRFERYLTILQDASIKPVIIINKTDLISPQELDLKLAEIRNRLGDIEIITTSAKIDDGISKLKEYIEPGKTYCFLGSSGVGKSSLINKLLGKEDIKTGDISSYSDRGKHVTTSREMYFLESGGIVIDNPGIREIGLTDVNSGVGNVFEEMAALAEKCKYADCTHIHEPGCEILAALADGRLDKERYLNFVNLKKEAEYFNMNRSEKREKERNFGKFVKNVKKELKNSGHKDF